jgi:hypothetical protein
MIVQNFGSFPGHAGLHPAGAWHFGRKKIFALSAVCAYVSTVVVFKFLTQPWQIFVLIPIMGFFQLALFAGFAIYLPELFPLRLRSTGTSFCYNVGRFRGRQRAFYAGRFAASSVPRRAHAGGKRWRPFAAPAAGSA